MKGHLPSKKEKVMIFFKLATELNVQIVFPITKRKSFFPPPFICLRGFLLCLGYSHGPDGTDPMGSEHMESPSGVWKGVGGSRRIKVGPKSKLTRITHTHTRTRAHTCTQTYNSSPDLFTYWHKCQQAEANRWGGLHWLSSSPA